MVEFGILGSLQVAADGGAIDVGGGRRRGLLARLLIDANRVVPLDRLIHDVLPEGTQAPTATVRTYVSRLRRVIGTDRLLTRSPGYVVVVEPGELDADRFESLVERSRGPGVDPATAVEVYEDAERLWRGPALAEFADLAWARPVAQRLDRLRLDAATDRLDALLACGRPGKVVGEAEALVERYPLDERLWGLLLVGHYRSGRQADALRTYQRARTRLVEELGTEPGPALRALEQAVLRQDPALGAGFVVAPPANRPAAPSPTVTSDLSWLPPAADALVGRQPTLETLVARVAAASAGDGGVVLVSGEAGAGKTRLLATLAERADAQGCLVLYGCCDEDNLVPYQAFVDALTPALRQAVPHGLVEPGSLSADLALLFPDVDGNPDAVAYLDAETRRHRLFEGIDRCLDQLARHRTVVLLVDDLHFADRGVLRLLQRVVRAGATRRMVTVAAFRPDEAGAGDQLRATLAGLRRQLPVVEVSVPALTEDDVVQLLEPWTDGRAGDSDHGHGHGHGLGRDRLGLARRIHRETAGNALFVTELIRDLFGRDLTDLDELPLPATAADLIGSRVGRLRPPTRRLLTAAAVVGTSFELAVAADVAALDDGAAVDAIDEALAHGIIGQTGCPSVPECFTFSHAIVRRALYERLATPRQARLHLATAQALVRRHGLLGGSVEAMAHHLVTAATEGVGDAASAVRYCRLAGDRAVLKLSYETAIEHYRRAIDLLGHAAPGAELLRCELLLLLGEALNEGGDTEEAKEHLLAAAAMATAQRRWSLVTRAALAFGGALPAGIGLPDERGVRLLRGAVDAQPPEARRERALLLGRLAEAQYLTAPRARRMELCTEAVAIARALDDRPTLATVLVNRFWALLGPDDAEAALRSAAEVERLADELGDVELSLRAAKCRLQTLITLDAWSDALELADTLRRRARDVRQPEQERLALSFDAVLAGNAGRFAEAERLAGAAYELLLKRRGQRAHAEVVSFFQRLPWRWLESRAGELLDARNRLADLRRSEPFWGAVVDTTRPSWHALAAWLLAECGQAEPAAEHLRAADLAGYLGGGRGAEFWHTTAAAALAASLLGERDHARLLYEHLLPYRERNAFVGQVAFLGCVEHHLGMLARTLGLPAADDHFRRALARYRAMGATAYATHVEAVASSVLADIGAPRH